VLVDQIAGDGSNVARLIDVESRKEVGRVDLAAGPTGIVLGQASWTRRGVAAAGFLDETSFAVWLSADDNGLALTGYAPLGQGLLNGLNEPYLDDFGEIHGWSVDETIHPDSSDNVDRSPYVLMTCTSEGQTCVRDGVVGLPNLQVGRVRTASRSTNTIATLQAEEA